MSPRATRALIGSFVLAFAVLSFACVVFLKTIPVGDEPNGVTVDATRNRTYVANFAGDSVSIIDNINEVAVDADPSTPAVIDALVVGDGPTELAVNTTTNKLYVPNFNANTVTVINLNDNTIAATVTGFAQPFAVAVNMTTNRIYVTNYGNGTVSVIDGSIDSLLAANVTVGANPRGIEVNATTNRIYVANFDAATAAPVNDTLSVIDGATNLVTATVPVGANPYGVAVNPTINNIYVANSGSNSVTVINGGSNTVSTTTAVGTEPRTIASRSGNAPASTIGDVIGAVYVANYGSNDITILDTAGSIVRQSQNSSDAGTFPTGTNPEGIAVNSTTNRIYVADRGDDALRVLIDGATTFTVTNTGDAGTGSLRQAITDSNNTREYDRIAFTLSGTAPYRFNVGANGDGTSSGNGALPVITNGVTIDGTTQSGFDPTTFAPVIELDGTNAGSGANGLTVSNIPSSPGTLGSFLNVRGLSIGNFSGNALSAFTSQVLLFTSPTTYTSPISVAGVPPTTPALTTIQGCYIGVRADGVTPAPNGGRGILLDGVSQVTIGGVTAGQANLITANSGAGIALINNATQNRITRNSIYANGGLGIDLGNDGITPNDGDNQATTEVDPDSDTGANNLQNFPIVAAAFQGSTIARGSLTSTPNSTFTLEFFYNLSASPTEAEGQVFVGATSVTTDANGDASFAVTFSDVTAPAGSFVTATATDAQGNTSEFSIMPLPTADEVVIAGTVRDGRGASIANASVRVSGSAQATTVSDANGHYRFTLAAGGIYQVSVSARGHRFSPATRTFGGVTTNETADFTALPVKGRTVLRSRSK
ncbi:MAG: carboxypeptidase regulatory-like domain-containing protein [Pyrinomonadaceae bacterium MAG19_C2-C3]|nr:carboxypeptidase regulatory-like domain-containing protein [Pyrinomonadaceae bacterium MAG19_C2-C3]